MCVYVCIYIYIHTDICMCIHTYVSIYVCIYVGMRVCGYVCMCVRCVCVYVCTSVNNYACMPACILRVHTCMFRSSKLDGLHRPICAKAQNMALAGARTYATGCLGPAFAQNSVPVLGGSWVVIQVRLYAL